MQNDIFNLNYSNCVYACDDSFCSLRSGCDIICRVVSGSVTFGNHCWSYLAVQGVCEPCTVTSKQALE